MKPWRLVFLCVASGACALLFGSLPSCSFGSLSPNPVLVRDAGDAGCAAVETGTTVSLGEPLPNLEFATDANDAGVVSLASYAEPCAPSAKLLVLRQVAGWCGTCQWHASHTARFLPSDVAARVQLVDLLLANENNQLAAATDLAAYRASGDGVADAIADPTFQLSELFDPRPALPLYVLVDARTLTPRSVLANPDPDTLTNALRSTLAALDGVTGPTPVPVRTFDGRFTADAWDIIHDMVLVQPPAPDPTNHVADDPQAALFGLKLFETSSLSPVQVGCRSCHDPALLLCDGKSTPPEGAAPAVHNVPSIVLAGYRKWLAWSGLADSLWMLAVLPVELDFEFASTRLYAAHAIFTNFPHRTTRPSSDPCRPSTTRRAFLPTACPAHPSGPR